MQIICFEDADVDRLRPSTRARPAHAITSDSVSFRLIDWLKRIPGKLSGHVRPYLQEIQKLDYGALVNARLAPTVGLDTPLLSLFKSASSSVVIDPECQAVRLAFISASDLAKLPVGQSQDVLDHAATLPQTPLKLDISRWTQDVIEHHMKQMPSAVNWHPNHEEYTEKIAVVDVRRNVQIGDYQVVDASEGPILLDKKVQVGPFCYLSGPVFLGTVLIRAVLFRAGTRVIDHAALKDGVSLGRTVKIVGEVEASIIEPYTNKQHHSSRSQFSGSPLSG